MENIKRVRFDVESQNAQYFEAESNYAEAEKEYLLAIKKKCDKSRFYLATLWMKLNYNNAKIVKLLENGIECAGCKEHVLDMYLYSLLVPNTDYGAHARASDNNRNLLYKMITRFREMNYIPDNTVGRYWEVIYAAPNCHEKLLRLNDYCKYIQSINVSDEILYREMSLIHFNLKIIHEKNMTLYKTHHDLMVKYGSEHSTCQALLAKMKIA
jgi:hypothetical protein